MKKKNSKLTNKQIEQNIARLYQEMGQIARVVDSIGSMVVEYIDYKGDKDGFAKHCESKGKKENDERGKQD
tara:strand:- start:28689 stop:28901 length:213 start_codon:yes stop_codon:yes gene_type:complete